MTHHGLETQIRYCEHATSYTIFLLNAYMRVPRVTWNRHEPEELPCHGSVLITLYIIARNFDRLAQWATRFNICIRVRRDMQA